MESGTGIWRARAVLVALLVGVGSLVGVAPAAADSTIDVNTTSTSTASDGLCALPEAVDWANGISEPDCAAGTASGTTTINLPAGKYVVPVTLMISSATNIVGAGASSTDIDGGGAVEVVDVGPAGNVTLSGLEISGGNSTPLVPCFMTCTTTPGNDGGGIYNDGTLHLAADTVDDNVAAPGITGYSIICFFGCTGDNGGAGGDGGGIYNTGKLTVTDSTISGNTAGAGSAGGGGTTASTPSGPGQSGGDGGQGGAGGGIYNAGGTLVITDSTVSANSAGAGGTGGSGSSATQSATTGGDAGSGGDGGSGGGLSSEGGSVTVVGSTFLGNKAGAGAGAGSPGDGSGAANGAAGDVGNGGPVGALDFDGSGGHTVTLANDTFTGNATGPATTAGDPNTGGVAGAIGLSLATATLTNLTVAGNSASSLGGGIYETPLSTVTLRNSIIASNSSSDGNSCDGLAMIDGGHNITFGNQTAGVCPGAVADPKLQTLADNGGPTQTMRLSAGSPAIDLVPASSCAATTDQRGVSRPQGAGCDAGAYEVAPPDLAAFAASASSPTSATVSGQVTPNLRATQVTVRYGTSTGYGTTTGSTDIGADAGSEPFSTVVSGLVAGKTYHFQVAATNADGTSTSDDLTVTTPPVAGPPVAGLPVAGPALLRVVVPNATVKGDVVMVRLACATGGSTCSGGLKLTSHVTTRGHRVVAVKASAAHSRKPRRKTVVRIVGSGRYSVAAGQTKVIKLNLNAAGQRLLKARHRLPTTLTSSGAARFTHKVTFIYKPKHGKRRLGL